MAAGRTDAQIQLTLRWASDDALKIYKVANVEQYAAWLLDAERQDITGRRAIQLPRALPTIDHLDRVAQLHGARNELLAIAARADNEATGATVETAEGGPTDFDEAAF